MKKIKLLALASLLAASGVSFAGTTNANLNVSANVLSVCSLQDASLNFGDYDATASAPTTASSSINIMCSKNTSYAVTVIGGDSPAMTNGVDQLNFVLNRAADTVWGSISAISGTGTGAVVNHPFSGIIAPGQAVSSGSYTKTLVMKVTY